MKAMIKDVARKLGYDIVPWPDHLDLYRVAQMINARGVDCVVDVGANRGDYSSALRRFGYKSHLVSFEPVESVFRELRRRSEKDPLWEVNKLAVGAERGEVEINVAGNDAASSSVLTMLPAHKHAAPSALTVGREVVGQTTLDDHLGAYSKVRSVFLKLDVQGYEREVLFGAKRLIGSDIVTGIQIEMSLIELYEGSWRYENVADWMLSHDFRLVRIIPGFTNQKNGDMLQCDGVFFRGGHLDARRSP